MLPVKTAPCAAPARTLDAKKAAIMECFSENRIPMTANVYTIMPVRCALAGVKRAESGPPIALGRRYEEKTTAAMKALFDPS